MHRPVLNTINDRTTLYISPVACRGGAMHCPVSLNRHYDLAEVRAALLVLQSVNYFRCFESFINNRF